MAEKIIVVDDEKEIAELVTTFLRNEGFQVEPFMMERVLWLISKKKQSMWQF